MASLGKVVTIVRCDRHDKIDSDIAANFGKLVTLFNEDGYIVNPINFSTKLISVMNDDETLSDVERYAMQDLVKLMGQAKEYDWVFFPA